MSIASLHIIGSARLGGAERFYVRLVNALAAHGQPVATLTVAGGEIDAALDPAVVRHHAPLAGVWDAWSRWRIGRTVRAGATPIVQTYMGRATRLTHLPPGGAAVHVARLGGFYDLKGYRHAHAWIGNTRGICDYLIRGGLPAERVFQIGNFVDLPVRSPAADLAQLRGRWQIPDAARVILGLGRLHPNKGFADLLTAFARLPAAIDGRPLHLVLVGDGPLRAELQAQAAQLGIAGRVTWAGWQYDPAPWYQLADIFVCPSRHEPLGNVILEAWANRVPVVSTTTHGAAELIVDGHDGLLTPLGDAVALADGIRRALALGAAERDALTAAGVAKVDREFSQEAIIEAYLALYRRLAGTPLN